MPDGEPHEVFHYPAGPEKIFSSASSLSLPVGGQLGDGGERNVTKLLREGNSPASDKENLGSLIRELSGSQVTSA